MGAVDLNTAVLLFSAVIVLALLGMRLSHRIGMPVLLVYLLIGLVLGESGIGIQFEDAYATQFVSTLLLGLILIDGGFTTKAKEVRPVLALSSVLASLGILVTIAVTFALTYLLLDVSVRTALLLGTVVASTDAAATFAVLRRLPLKRPTRAALEAESGFNDPPVIIIVGVLASTSWHSASPLGLMGNALYQLAGGAAIGVAMALVGRWVLSRIALPTSGLYPLAVLAIALGAFAVAGSLGASSILAGYVAGLVLGNSRLPHHGVTETFTSGIASLGQIILFVMLGLLASPERLPSAILPALVVGAALTFVARPFALLVCATPFRVPLREQAFMSWAGLRGAVPIVVATIPMSTGVPAAHKIFDVTFLLVVFFTLIQGPLLPWVAKITGVLDEHATRDVEFESAPLELVDATLLHVTVTEDSRMRGVHVDELRLPPKVMVSLVVRNDAALTPSAAAWLRAGDSLLVVTPLDRLGPTEERFRALAKSGRLAGWHDDDHAPAPRPDG